MSQEQTAAESMREQKEKPIPLPEKISAHMIHGLCWVLDKIVPAEPETKPKDPK